MIVLALNCGSTSVKFELLRADDRRAEDEGWRRLCRGTVAGLGDSAELRFVAEAGPGLRRDGTVPDHAAALRHVLDWLGEVGARPDAVGHRIVHGGSRFVGPALVDDQVTAAIAELETLAPLHNGPGLAGIRACRAALGRGVPMVAVFDTAFHATLPDHAACYAIPAELARRHGIRRYGFHGLAYQSVVTRYGRLTGVSPERVTIVALHLGGGCSAAAIREGRSVETSMGFTPLEGLVMATRSGDLDPAVVAHLARGEGATVEEVERWLNERSGLLGLSGTSGDVRDLLARAGRDPAARLAIEAFCHRAQKYVGAYLAALGGAQAVVFSGGIGENAAEVRARICRGLEWLGLALDDARNRALVGAARRISVDGSRLEAWVVPASEERVIAEAVAGCVERPDRGETR
jgi:acetate kinase